MVYQSGNQMWHSDSSFKQVPAQAALIWDNRCMLHRGRPWDAKRHMRVMHRTTVAGDGPTA